MTNYLDLQDALEVAEVVRGQPAAVRDLGLLDAAVHRPQTTLFGADAYPDVFTKAAALLESTARNRALVDGNKRLAWAATAVFLLDNGHSVLDVDQDDAYEFMIAVTKGTVELAEMARWLSGRAVPLPE